jgi:imidazolonepropionase-like amidohydrolase
MFEDSIGFEGDDGNEDSDPIMPQLRAVDAVNPFDRAFEDARRAGITTVVTGPGSANVIGGQFAALKTAGICVDDMILKAPAAMKAALGENPKSVYHGKNQCPLTRMGTMALLRETFLKTREYKEMWEEYYENTEENDKPELDIKLDAMLPVLNREIPLKVHAHRADDICTAIRLAKEFDIDVTIEHCTDGEAVADILVRENMPVMLGPTLTDRNKPEVKAMSFSTYKALSDKGLSVAIITDHPEVTIENLTLSAALAVKSGMDKYKALAALTCAAAENCRISDRVGTLTVGKDADIAVFSAHPLDFDAETLYTFINGKCVYSKNGGR